MAAPPRLLTPPQLIVPPRRYYSIVRWLWTLRCLTLPQLLPVPSYDSYLQLYCESASQRLVPPFGMIPRLAPGGKRLACPMAAPVVDYGSVGRNWDYNLFSSITAEATLLQLADGRTRLLDPATKAHGAVWP